jgi:hypothetical protein
MTTTERDLTAGGIELIQEVGSIRRKKGVEVRVAVKDAGHGPAVDVREYLTAELYPTGAVGETADRARKRRKGEGYVGPTRSGFWLSIEQALSLAGAILAAADVAESALQEGEAA